MSDTGDKETVGDIATVEKDETLSQEEIKIKNERIKLMGQLQRKLKTQKMMVTKNMNKKVGSEGGSAARLQLKAEEIVKIHDKLKEDGKEMDSIFASLAIEKLGEDVEGYLKKYKKLLEDNEEIIASAIERSLQVITSVTSVTIEQPTQSQDKFHCYSELKPKFLGKDSNLLEVRSWILQTKKDCIST